MNISSFTDSGTSIVVSLSCLYGGCLFGISSLVLVKRLRTHKQRLLQNIPTVFLKSQNTTLTSTDPMHDLCISERDF